MARSTVRSLVCAVLLSAVLGAGAATSAPAATVSGTYTGKVTLVEAPVAGAFAVNDTFTIHFSYDDTVADSEPADPIIGRYFNAATAAGSIGSYNFTGGSGTVTTAHGVAGASLSISLAGSTGSAVDDFIPGTFGFSLSSGRVCSHPTPCRRAIFRPACSPTATSRSASSMPRLLRPPRLPAS
jgi:hypothetical protein